MSYSSGRNAYGICDKTGFRYDLKDLVFENRNGSKTGLVLLHLLLELKVELEEL